MFHCPLFNISLKFCLKAVNSLHKLLPEYSKVDRRQHAGRDLRTWVKLQWVYWILSDLDVGEVYCRGMTIRHRQIAMGKIFSLANNLGAGYLNMTKSLSTCLFLRQGNSLNEWATAEFTGRTFFYSAEEMKDCSSLPEPALFTTILSTVARLSHNPMQAGVEGMNLVILPWWVGVFSSEEYVRQARLGVQEFYVQNT